MHQKMSGLRRKIEVLTTSRAGYSLLY